MNSREQLNERWNRVGQDVKETGRNVWLAGLGVFGALDERGRTVFSDLVHRGEKMDGKVDLDLLRPVNEAAGKVKSLGEKLERRAQDGMGQALQRLGLPSRNDVHQLIDRVDKLSQKVDGLTSAS